ncbi:hypothetical protein HPB51_000711 [Rhipicephalus microplus]|uniref:Retrotransposon gag domain-containing protein n=1 Tax=Rhipicephalus microplus TaxID=6941 RepID=A0A9J6D3N9_RHIMP|nr:hypothetical protein HPB51_000711 [Rhipicephalus microplus]
MFPMARHVEGLSAGVRCFRVLPRATQGSSTTFLGTRRSAYLQYSISQAAEKTEEEGPGATPDVYDSAVAALAKHFDATCNLVVERHRFHRRLQFPGESIQEYVTAQTELAAMCSFMSQEESLRDQFVAGVSSHRIQERLLLEGSSLSFNKAVALASQIE